MRRRAGWVVSVLLATLVLAACGPDLALLGSPHDLYITAIALNGPQSGWAVGLQPSKGRPVLLRENNGAWQVDANPPPTQQGDALKAIAITGDTLWVGGARADAAHGDATQESGFVFARTANGAWQRQQFGAPINGIAFTSATNGWAVGDGGTIYHDQAGTWTQFPNSMANDLYAIAARAPNDIWAVGEEGAFAHFDGTAWQHQAHFTHVNVYGLALTADDGWATGDDGTMIRLGSNGLWTEITAPINVTGRAVAIINGNVWMIGDHGLVFERTPDGQWQHIPPPGDAQLNAIAVTPSGTLWIGGNFSQSSIFSFASGGWRAVNVTLG
jgi:hypothetical protein